MAALNAVVTVVLLLVSGTAAQTPTLEQLQQIFNLLVAQNEGGPSAAAGQGQPPGAVQSPFQEGAFGPSSPQSQPSFPQGSNFPQPQFPTPTADSTDSVPGVPPGVIGQPAPQTFVPNAPPVPPQPPFSQPSQFRPALTASPTGGTQFPGSSAHLPGSTTLQFGPSGQAQGTGQPSSPGFGQQNQLNSPAGLNQPNRPSSVGQGSQLSNPAGFQGIAIQFPG